MDFGDQTSRFRTNVDNDAQGVPYFTVQHDILNYTAVVTPDPQQYFGGQARLTWVLNKSANAISYLSPTGTTETLASNKFDLFSTYNSTTERLMNDQALFGVVGDKVINDFKICTNNGNAFTIQLDNIAISSPSIRAGAEDVNAAKTQISTFPNPITNEAPSVSINLPKAQNCIAKVYSFIGELVYEKKLGALQAGANTVELNDLSSRHRAIICLN